MAQMLNLSVLFTRLTIPYATVKCHAYHERSTSREASLALTHGFLIQGVFLVLRETRLAPKMSNTFGAGISDVGESARNPSQNHYMSGHSDVWCQFCTLCYMLYIRTS